MRLTDLKERTVRVTVIPSVADRILVQQKDGRFVSMSVQKFVSTMVELMRKEVKENG